MIGTPTASHSWQIQAPSTTIDERAIGATASTASLVVACHPQAPNVAVDVRLALGEADLLVEVVGGLAAGAAGEVDRRAAEGAGVVEHGLGEEAADPLAVARPRRR